MLNRRAIGMAERMAHGHAFFHKRKMLKNVKILENVIYVY